jgi:hypothetical protein
MICKKLNTTRMCRVCLSFAVTLSLMLGGMQAHAMSTTYLTTLNLSTPVNNPAGIDQIFWSWTTLQNSGIVTQSGLVDLSMSLLSGGSPIYQDDILVGGTPQPIGGQARVLGLDIYWRFDLGSSTLLEMNNVLSITLDPLSSGTQFRVSDNVNLPTDSQVAIWRYVDGAQTSFTIDLLASQSTSVVPEPATLVLFGLGLVGLGYAGRRKLLS